MTIRINGKDEDVIEKETIRTYLQRRGFCETRVAVEQNGVIVPKAAYDTQYIADGDTLEIVSFVGGG